MSLLILNARIPVCSRLVPETHFSEYSLSILGVMMGMGGADTKGIEQPVLALEEFTV